MKNRNKTPYERRVAYLELKRLNQLKNTGNILMMPDIFMLNMNYKNPDFHNYLVYNTDKNNNTKVNLITHSKISSRRKINSLDSYLGLKIIDSDKKNRSLKFYNFYESKINNLIDKKELNLLLNDINILPYNQNKIKKNQ